MSVLEYFVELFKCFVVNFTLFCFHIFLCKKEHFYLDLSLSLLENVIAVVKCSNNQHSNIFFLSILDNILPPIAPKADILLQPVSATNNNSQQSLTTPDENASINCNNSASAQQVGATWADNLKAGNLKLDLDNLLSSKKNKTNAPAPSMNALKVQSPNLTPNTNSQQVPLSIQTPAMGNFAAFGVPTTTPRISPGLGNAPLAGSAPTFFNATSPNNIPSHQQQQSHFANLNQMSKMMQTPQELVSNKNKNNNNLQSFDLFQ